MGCEIHFFVEKRVDGVWTMVYPKMLRVRNEMRPSLIDSFPGIIVDTNAEWRSIDKANRNPSFEMDRNYDVFAALANVRNYEGIVPIAEPKGPPPDASPGFLWEIQDWGRDGHSPSWLTLTELLSYNWDQKMNIFGNLSKSFFVKKVIPALQALGDPEDVRICFFFDN